MPRRSFGKGGVEALRYTGGHTSVRPDGYVQEYCPDHPSANRRGMVLQHRLVKERQLGQLLPRTIAVHHLNGDKRDNRPENLELLSGQSEHMRRHHRETAKRWDRKLLVRVRQLAADPDVTTKAAAKKLHMSPMTLHAMCLEHGVQWHRRTYPEGPAIEAVLRGTTRTLACKKLGLSLQTLWNHFPEEMRRTATRKLPGSGAKPAAPGDARRR